MKKFLSVLLALAVAFTFTFGSTMSAFAAEGSSYYTYGPEGKYATEALAEAAYLADVDAAELVVLTALKSNYDIAVIKVTQNGAKATTIETATAAKIEAKYWLEQLEVEYNDVKAAVLNKTRELKSENWKDDTAKLDASVYNSVTKGDSALANDVYSTEKYAFAALKAGFADYQADAVKRIQSVNTTIYSTTEYTKEKNPGSTYLWAYPTAAGDKECYTAKEIADKILEYAVTLVNAEAIDATKTTVTGDTGLTSVYNAVDTVVSTYTNAGLAADGKTYAYTLKAYNSKNPYTVAQENYDKSGASAKTAAAKADLEGRVSDATYATRTFTAAQLAAWTVLKDAYVEVETANIDGTRTTVEPFPYYIFDTVNGETVAKEMSSDESDATEVTDGYIFKVNLVDKYEAFAANLKASKNTDGTAAYDSAKVDTILAELIEDVYAGSEKADPSETKFAAAKLDTVSAYAKNALKATITNLMDADTYSHKISINGTTYAISEASAAAEYYAKEWADVEAAVDAYKAAIDAAATNADVTAAAKALKTALDAIKVKSSIVYDAATIKAVNDAEEMASAYVLTINAGKADADKVPSAPADLTEWFKENGARSAADVVALYDTLKAELAGKLSSNAMKDAVKALQDQIDALPASLLVTVADTDQIVACKKAFEEFAEDYIAQPDMTTTNYLVAPYSTYYVNATALGKAYAALLTAKQKEIFDAEKAIAKGDCALVTLADKEAVNAVLALVNAYYDITEAYPAVASPKAGVTERNWVKTALETIRNLEAKEVAKAVNSLPTEITAADKEAVEAARAAYDAFVAEYTYYDANNVYGAAYDAVSKLESVYKVNLGKLEAAEATIATVIKYDDVNAKADLLDMSRKLTIWRTSKTSIKVTAVGSVKNIKDNGYTVKYKFYKKAPGATSYKLVKTTTSNKYTYTNLKKGTNKFQVKVCVYDADGKLVATKMTYYRAAKIK